nr:hypothetical protein [Kiritimatiellia bacterium]
FLIFMKFHVFHGSIQIGIGVGIAIGIDCRAHETARNDECKGGGGPEPDPDGDISGREGASACLPGRADARLTLPA